MRTVEVIRRLAAIEAAIGLGILVVVLVLSRPMGGDATTTAMLAALAAAMVALALRSPAYPVALAGVPSIVIGILGYNPFPSKSVPIAVFVWLGIAIAAFLAVREAVPSRMLLTGPLLFSLGLAFLMLLALPSSPSPEYAQEKFELYLVANVPLLLAGTIIGSRSRDFTQFAGLALAVATVGAVVLARGIHGRTLDPVLGGDRYALSQEQYPIELGRQTGFALLIALFLMMAGRSRPLRWAGVAALPALAIAMLAAGSRGPFLALAAGLLVLVTLALGIAATRRRLAFVAVAVAIAAATVPAFVPQQSMERSLSAVLGTPEGMDSNGRFDAWGEAVDVAKAHPLWGIGPGGFESVDMVNVYPHNIVLEVAAELGAPGAALILGLLANAAALLVGAWRRATSSLRPEVALAASLFVFTLVNALLSMDIQQNAGLWLSTGFATGLALRCGRCAGFRVPNERSI